MRLTDLRCPAIVEQYSAKPPGDLPSFAKSAAANHHCGTAAACCTRFTRDTIQQVGPPFSSSQALLPASRPAFDRFLIRSEDQLSCGVPEPLSRNAGTRAFRPLPKTKGGWHFRAKRNLYVNSARASNAHFPVSPYS